MADNVTENPRNNIRFNKSYYISYVDHMLRFYCRYPEISEEKFRTEIDKNNWLICKDIVSNLKEPDRQVVFDLYRSKLMSFAMDEDVAAKNGVSIRVLWGIVRDVRESIARKRGLI